MNARLNSEEATGHSHFHSRHSHFHSHNKLAPQSLLSACLVVSLQRLPSSLSWPTST